MQVCAAANATTQPARLTWQGCRNHNRNRNHNHDAQIGTKNSCGRCSR